MNPLALFSENENLRSHYSNLSGIRRIELRLKNYITYAKHRPLVILCIGTDRSTGDSLGPLTGTKLSRLKIPGVTIIGTLENPVHAENLADEINKILISFTNPYILALDACLGNMDSIGYITLSKGALKPGTAVNKNLPTVGDAHITGIVNISGFMEYMILQNTRLNIIWEMSDVIYGLFYRALIIK